MWLLGCFRSICLGVFNGVSKCKDMRIGMSGLNLMHCNDYINNDYIPPLYFKIQSPINQIGNL